MTDMIKENNSESKQNNQKNKKFDPFEIFFSFCYVQLEKTIIQSKNKCRKSVEKFKKNKKKMLLYVCVESSSVFHFDSIFVYTIRKKQLRDAFCV